MTLFSCSFNTHFLSLSFPNFFIFQFDTASLEEDRKKMLYEEPISLEEAALNANDVMVAPSRKSYVHGCSTVPLLFETVGDRLRSAVDQVPDKEFLIFKREGIRKTYSQVATDAENLACGLLHLGLNKGDRIGIWGPNTYEWTTTQFATALAGMVLVNINPSYQSEELRYAIEKVGIRCLITPPGFKKSNYYQSIKDILPEVTLKEPGKSGISSRNFTCFQHLIMFDEEDKIYPGAWKYTDVMKMGTEEDRHQLSKIERETQPDDSLNIQYTSGTTGQPKGATLTHHNVLNNAFFVGLRAGYSEKKTIICIPNPLYHCFGCVMGVLAALTHLQTCVFPAPSFDALAALQAIHEEKCTALYGTPTMFIDMINHPEYGNYNYDSIRSGFIAGAPCPITLCRRLVQDMHMTDMQVCYGTTETSPVSFMSTRDDPPEQRIKSVGHIMDHLEAAIVDKRNCIVPRGVKGEVIVRGYSVMRCYWNSEEQTKKEITQDRWYHTGDIAVMHDNGTISIVGRSKDMIVRGGENIYPTEVEQFLFKHQSVEDVHIVGVPDERFGEVVCAWVRLHESAEGKTTEEDIKAWCKGKIAHFKIPRYILFKKEHQFPLTVTGKVKKFEIREMSKIELGLQQVVSHFSEL
ncbi:hypothetical protein CAEBREN_25008 [Caenorhabditis brenneri]|uniref:Medium-chain acyl-CoA ligase ACSF2, mitochondrial n=1 Tax=Caenorhabditis brenneri TaxID=135651 RepID=G0MXW1_CAEBE|nr:hypothetical protein CAEBREN_25008 [Caenorhabditis brenneri]